MLNASQFHRHLDSVLGKMEKSWRGIWFCGWDQQSAFLEVLKKYPRCHNAKPIVWCKKSAQFKDISVQSGSLWNQNCEFGVWAVFGEEREVDNEGKMKFRKLEPEHFPFGRNDLPQTEKTRLRMQCFAARCPMETEKYKVKQHVQQRDGSLTVKLTNANHFEKGPWVSEHAVGLFKYLNEPSDSRVSEFRSRSAIEKLFLRHKCVVAVYRFCWFLFLARLSWMCAPALEQLPLRFFGAGVTLSWSITTMSRS